MGSNSRGKIIGGEVGGVRVKLRSILTRRWESMQTSTICGLIDERPIIIYIYIQLNPAIVKCINPINLHYSQVSL